MTITEQVHRHADGCHWDRIGTRWRCPDRHARDVSPPFPRALVEPRRPRRVPRPGDAEPVCLAAIRTGREPGVDDAC